jgi:uncharacterized Fe-S radical SAM superfamily protein PflX
MSMPPTTVPFRVTGNTADHAEAAAVCDIDAEGRLDGDTEQIVDMRAAPRCCRRECLVDRDADAAGLAAIHALEVDEMSGLVGHRNAHGHVDVS